MKYFIRPIFPTIGQPTEIDEAEYKEITDARKLAWDVLLIKELFSYVARNYSLLESEIQKIEAKDEDNQDLFYDNFRIGSFQRDTCHTFNLLLINLLTTSRSYLELFDYKGLNQDREAFSEEECIREGLQSIKNKYHNGNIIYVFFWELRNYTQHHSQPITGVPYRINNGIVRIDRVIASNE